MKTAQQWHEEGKAFLKQRKFAEAHKCLDEAINLNPGLMDAYNDKYSILFNEGKFAEVIPWCDKALENNPKDSMSLFSKGRALYSQKQYPEALVWLDKAIELYPNWAVPLNTKGNVLRFQGKPDEAIKALEKSAQLDEKYVYPLRNISLICEEQGRLEDALKYIEQAIEREPKDAHYLIDKGSYLKKLGRKSEALEVFRKANQLYAEGSFNIDLIPTQIQWIKDTLKSLDELEKAEADAQESIKKADQNNPKVKDLVNRLISLQKEKQKVTNNVVDKMGNNSASSDKVLFDEMKKLKDEFLQVQQQLAQVQAEVKVIKNEMQEVKEELANKMDDFNKKLDNELSKRDIPPEDKAKIKDYFKAFIETFSSIYVTSQVVDSGQVQLDADSTKASVLSVIASFTPFIGSALQSSIKSLGDFLQSKEMKTNARKMKRIAHDSTALSQLLGSSAYEIVLHQEKQQQILTITSEDLKQASASLFSKMAEFCENLNENIDVYLYSQLYTSPAARLGHNDANLLIEDWINDKVDPYEISKHFIKETTNLQKELPKKRTEEVEISESPTAEGNRGCCNMF